MDIRRKGFLLGSVLLLVSMLACTKEPNVSDRIVVDQMGRSVSLPHKIERVVSVYYLTTSTTIALGKQELLVGIENSIGSWGSLYERVAPELYHLPSVGSLKGISVEEIMRLDPDLVILPLKLKDQLELLERSGLRVLVIDPERPESYEVMILLLGEVYGAQEKAQQLVDYYQNQRRKITQLLADVPASQRIYLSGSTPFNTAPQQMYQHELISLAKGLNVAGELTSDYWVNISPEQLVLWNPDMWLVVQYAKYTLDDIYNNPQLQGMQALENGNIIIFPSLLEPWDYPTSSAILGLSWLTSLLHPEVYSYDSFLHDAQTFFKDVYDLELDASDMGV